MRMSITRSGAGACLRMAGLLIIITGIWAAAAAQPGPSFSAGYEFYPHSSLSSPDTSGGAGFLDTGTIRVGTLTLNASYPLIFAQGRTVLANALAYRRFDLDYEGFAESATDPENVQAISYSATVTHVLSERWTLMGILEPGIASDFETDLGRDDLTLQAVAIFIRTYSERTQLGYGLAWANTFGQPFPMPILAANWNNGARLRISAILPANLEVWYGLAPTVEAGVLVSVDGNQYHGDPDIYQVGNPLMRYSIGTIGPSVSMRLSEGIGLRVDTGVSFLRRFEFFDGDNDEDQYDYSLNNAAFARVTLQYGG
jgi:hypothetical protein